MKFNNMHLLIFALVILIAVIVYNLFTIQENFAFREKQVSVGADGVPTTIIRDEYGSMITDNYYLEPYGIERWPTGKYKTYTVKQIPYGYKLINPVDVTSGITASTAAATQSDAANQYIGDLPDYRELLFSEYKNLPGKPNWKKTRAPPADYFNVGAPVATDSCGNRIYNVAKIPLNHKLLQSGANPEYKYLAYSGAYQDIPGYTYGGANTGEYEMGSTTTVLVPPTGMYKIRLVTSYNDDDTEKTVKYVVANILTGWKLDPTDTTYTKLVPSTEKYDPTNIPTTDSISAATSDINMGTYYQFDDNGQLVEVQTRESNFAPILYYIPGAYKFGSSNFVPNYEDSVYLSRLTRESQVAPVVNTAGQLGGFCEANVASPQKIEEKCNAMDLDACASMSCCVLLGGQKCVAGNASGPHFTANYSDYNLRNKDFYYYQGKCYGHCL